MQTLAGTGLHHEDGYKLYKELKQTRSVFAFALDKKMSSKPTGLGKYYCPGTRTKINIINLDMDDLIIFFFYRSILTLKKKKKIMV